MFFVLSIVKSQTVISVGNGTATSNNFPINGYYDFSWASELYYQSELGMPANITKISFNVYSVSSNFTMNNQKIYMRHTSTNSFADANYPGTSGFTLVYDGSITYAGTGWKDITLTTPFAYNGTDNLEVLLENRDGSYALSGYPVFYYTSGQSNYRLKRDYKDGSFPTTSNAPSARFQYISNTKLTKECNSTLSLTPTSATVCSGVSTTLTASGNSTYSWSPSTGLNQTTGASVEATPTSTTTYTVTGTDANGCVQAKTTTITVNSLPTVSISPSSATICNGQSTGLTAAGAISYSWSPSTGLNQTTGASVTASPTSTITYTVTGTSTAGCTNTATVTVTVNSVPSVSVTPVGTTACANANTNLTASGATTYTWNPTTALSASTGSSVTANPASSISYTVTGYNGSCSDTAIASITVNTVNAGIAQASGGSDRCSNSAVSLSVSDESPKKIGNGTSTSNNYPFNGYYDYSWADVIYLQNEIGASGNITKIALRVANTRTSSYTMNNQKIYMKHTTSTSHAANTYPGTSGYTLVYDGSIVYPTDSGTITITLSTPFSFNGTDNLDVLFENRDASWATGYPTFNYTTVSGNRTKRDYKDASFPTTCNACSSLALIPNITFYVQGTLSTFVKWQYSLDNSTYTDLSGGTTANCNTTAQTSTWYRAQYQNGSCTAYSTPVKYNTSNNYYVNDNSTTGDVFTSAVGSSSNNGITPASPKATITQILSTYDLEPCDTVFVDKGDYTESVTITQADGGSAGKYVVFKGAGKDKAKFTAATSGNNFFLQQPDYVSINGFELNSTQTNYVNILVYESTGNKIENNKITHTASTNISVIGHAGTSNLDADYNKILNNEIINSGVDFHAVFVSGDCDSTEIKNNSISMSSTSSTLGDAIMITTYYESFTAYFPLYGDISGNTLEAQRYGISIFGYDHQIEGYKIYGNSITIRDNTTNDAAGIWLYKSGNTSTLKTEIYNNRLINGENGIYIGNYVNYVKIYNNYFANNDYGIYVSNSNSYNGELYFNSFYNNQTNAYFTGTANSYWKLRNNIFYNTGTTTSSRAIFAGSTNLTFIECNHNQYYLPNGAITARFSSTDYTTLANWQSVNHSDETTGNGNGDNYSQTGNPLYVNASFNNLDVSASSPVLMVGYAISGITTDINGASRNTPPSIGADEPSPGINAGSDTEICNGSSTGLSASGALNYTWSPSTGLSATNIANPSANPSSTTTYTVTTTIGNQSATDYVVVKVNANPSVNAGNDLSYCSGSSGNIGGNPSASGGTPTYTYTWSPSTGLSATNVANPSVSSNTAQSYTLIVNDTKGCTGSDIVAITVHANPTIDAGNNKSICLFDSVKIGGNPLVVGGNAPYLYSWYPDLNLSSPSIPNPYYFGNSNTQQTINIYVVDSNGCSGNDSILITIDTLPFVKFKNSDTTVCSAINGIELVIESEDSVQINWSSNVLGVGFDCNTNCEASNIIYSSTSAEIYATAINQNGCKNIDTSFIVINNTNLNDSSVVLNNCSGNTVSVIAPSSIGNNYSWYPEGVVNCASCQSPSFNNCNGNVQLFYYPINECPRKITYISICKPILNFSLNKFLPDTICATPNDTIVLTLPVDSSINVNWSSQYYQSCTSCSTLSFLPDTNGNLLVNISDSSCSVIDTVHVIYHSPIDIVSYTDTASTSGQDFTINYNANQLEILKKHNIICVPINPQNSYVVSSDSIGVTVKVFEESEFILYYIDECGNRIQDTVNISCKSAPDLCQFNYTVNLGSVNIVTPQPPQGHFYVVSVTNSLNEIIEILNSTNAINTTVNLPNAGNFNICVSLNKSTKYVPGQQIPSFCSKCVTIKNIDSCSGTQTVGDVKNSIGR